MMTPEVEMTRAISEYTDRLLEKVAAHLETLSTNTWGLEHHIWLMAAAEVRAIAQEARDEVTP